MRRAVCRSSLLKSRTAVRSISFPSHNGPSRLQAAWSEIFRLAGQAAVARRGTGLPSQPDAPEWPRSCRRSWCVQCARPTVAGVRDIIGQTKGYGAHGGFSWMLVEIQVFRRRLGNSSARCTSTVSILEGPAAREKKAFVTHPKKIIIAEVLQQHLRNIVISFRLIRSHLPCSSRKRATDSVRCRTSPVDRLLRPRTGFAFITS